MSADEEKTKVLPRKPAADAAAAPDGDKIVFRCPNGHRIVAPVAQAGKRGACSKCKIPVTIPAAGAAKAVSTAGPVEPVPPPAAVKPPADASAPAIGPPDLLPDVTDDGGAVTVGGSEQPVAGEEENWSFISDQAEPPPADAFETSWEGTGPTPRVQVEGSNPTAVLVARLWVERQHGGIIELHLDGGSVILPEWYDANWSRGTHGLFASQAADGSVTLTAVAWDTVRKIVVRQLTEVPDDMFA